MNYQYNPKNILYFLIVLFVFIVSITTFEYMLFFNSHLPDMLFPIITIIIPISTLILTILLRKIKHIVFSKTSIDYYIGNIKYRSLSYNNINSLYISAAVGSYNNTILKNGIPVPFISAFPTNNIESLLTSNGHISIFKKKWCRYLFAIEITNSNSLAVLLKNTSTIIYITSGILMNNSELFRDFTKEYAQRIVVIN